MKNFALVLLLITPLSAAAATLTLGEALARVEAGHPWFRTRATAAALAQARQDAAGARPPAELSLQLENALGSGEFRAVRGLETTLQFSRALDWAERRTARREAAGALNESDQLAWEENRRGLLAESARRFILVVGRQAALAATREQADLARQTADDLQARATQAVATPADVARARLALTESNLAAEHAEHELAAARQNLASLWGATTPDFDQAVADFTTLPPVDSYEQLVAKLAGTPAQVRQAALVRWRQAQEKLALATAARGEPRWSAGIRRNEAAGDFGLVLGLGYGWPSAATARAGATEARAERERTAAEGEAALNELRAALYELCQELNHARIEHDSARDEMLPAAREWLAGIEAGAATGRYAGRDLLEARAALFGTRQRQIHAATAYHVTLVEIELLLTAPGRHTPFAGHVEP
jgi:cobalt-zinc-cadmium efflux system outer membrane protein